MELTKQLSTIPFNIRSISDAERSFVAIASDATVDRHGETIIQEGWDVDNFKKNPVIPWGHNYQEPPIAKATEIGVEDGKLVFKAQFATAEEYPFADTIFKLYRGGYLRAFSVGFIPLEVDGDTYKKSELLEISAVTVPSNPNALTLAYKEGVINDSERKTIIGRLSSQVKALTDLAQKDNTNPNEDNQVEELTKKVDELETEVAEIKTGIEDISTKMTTLIEKSEESAKASEDKTEDEGAEGLTDEEAKAFIESHVEKTLAEAKGKVE